MTTNSEQKHTHSWGEFYETTKNCSEYNEEIRRKFVVFEALDRATNLPDIRQIIDPLSQNEINWLNSPCLDGIIASKDDYLPLCRKEFFETVKYYTEKGLYIVQGNIDEFFIRFSAAGHTKSVEYLLQKGADIHLHDNIAILWACRNNHIETVKFLLDHGASIHNNNTLSIICIQGSTELVKLLLTTNCHVNNTSYALSRACEYGHFEIAKLLLENGADIHYEDDTALYRASIYGNVNIVKLLLDYKANIHAQNDIALRRASELEHTEVVKLLLENGANIHAENDYALKSAFDNCNSEMVKLLIQYGANMNALDLDALRKKRKFLSEFPLD